MSPRIHGLSSPMSGTIGTAPEGVGSTSRGLTQAIDLDDWRATLNGTRICTESDCSRTHFGRGYCRLHYTRHSRYSPELVGNRLCKVEGCEQGQEARGYCYNHDRRFLAYGDPLAGPLSNRATISARLERHSAHNGECVEWTGPRDRRGYGRIGVDRAMRAAHRVAYAEAFGAIPDGLVVRHKCDNPPCINPAHLEVGTKADNARDMVERGRSTAGERNPASKLTNQQAVELYRRGLAGEGREALASEFDISVNSVYRIIAGTGWAAATGANR